MKFVCDRCQTRYSIADEKVRGKILKVRCKSCQNVITVRETGVGVAEAPAFGDAGAFEHSASGVHQSGSGSLNVVPAAASSAPALAGATVRPAPSAARVPVAATTPAPPPLESVQWFVALDGKQSGPYSRKGLLDKLAALPNGADVHIWNERMDGWKPPEQVPAIARELMARRRPMLPLPGVSGPAVPPPPAPRARTSSGTQPVVPHGAGVRRPSRPIPIAAAAAATSSHAEPAHALAAAPATEAPGAANGAHPRSKKAGNGVALHTSGTAPLAPPLTLEPDPGAALTLEPPAEKAGESVPEALAESALAAVAAGGTDVAHPSANWQSTSVPLITTSRQRSTRLILASLGIVGVIVALVTFVLIGKKPTPVAEKTKSPAAVDDGFSKLADKLANEARVAKESPPPIVEPVPAVEPSKAETVAVVKPSKIGGKNGRKGGKGGKGGKDVAGRGGVTAPPAFQPGSTPGVAPEAVTARPSDGIGERAVQLPRGGGGGKQSPQQSDISRVINNNKNGIKTCYQRALLKDSSLTHGKITVKLAIGISGRVKKVDIDGPTAFQVLQPCIKDMVSRWVFPASSEPYDTEFVSAFQGNE